MGDVHPPTPALLLFAATSRHEEALAWGLRQSEAEFGAVAAVSDAFDFTETDYYATEMGVGLKKQFWAFDTPIDPGRLAAIKRQTNFWEAEYAGLKTHAEPRPLNLDPGYVTLDWTYPDYRRADFQAFFDRCRQVLKAVGQRE
jgi:hypothetical protein